MRNASLYILMITACVAFYGCQGTPDAGKLGVFAETDKGLIELAVFGAWHRLAGGGFMSAYLYDLPVDDSIPRAKQLSVFYVNMPDVQISSCLVYLGKAGGLHFDERGSSVKTITVSTELIKDTMYKLSSEALAVHRAEEDDVLVILKVSMAGGSDRLYPVRLVR